MVLYLLIEHSLLPDTAADFQAFQPTPGGSGTISGEGVGKTGRTQCRSTGRVLGNAIFWTQHGCYIHELTASLITCRDPPKTKNVKISNTE